MQTLIQTAAGLICGAAFAVGALAQTKPAGAVPTPDDGPIRRAEAAFVKAYNAGDAKAVAALFADDAEVVEAKGGVVRGKSAIEKLFAASFASSPGETIESTIESIRFLSPDLALEKGKASIRPSKSASEEFEAYEILYVKRGDQWLQLRVTEIADHAVSAHEHLKQLEWLIGEWVEESSESVAHMTCQWSEDKQFLLRSFTVRIDGSRAASGTQRIGWDPATGCVRSWTFNSSGGFGEAEWFREGDRWLIKSRDTLPDGSRTGAVHIMTRSGASAIRWRSTARTLDSRSLPDGPEMTLIKRPPMPVTTR